MISVTAKAALSGVTGTIMKAAGSKERKTEKACFTGSLEIGMTEAGSPGKKKDKESSGTQMVANMTAAGVMTRSTGRGRGLIRKGSLKWDSGLRGK